MNSITIVYCYRNREFQRIKRSLDSLSAQDNLNFQVIFVDYGSELEIAAEMRKLVMSYPFADYIYNDTRGMPWNRSHALNNGIRLAKSDYIFTADVDMIFRKDFISTCHNLVDNNTAHFFSVYYLPEHADLDNVNVTSFDVKSKTYALGLGLIPRKALMEIRGYDEFFCFWGKEDNDIEHRLKMAGIDTLFYEKNVLLYHMYHVPIHQDRETMPAGWLIFQDSYFVFMKNIVIRNEGNEWGRIFKVNERDCIRMINDSNIEYLNITGQNDFFSYVLNRSFINAQKGEFIKLYFKDEVSHEFEKSSLNKMTNRINKYLKKLKFPFRTISVYLENYEDVYNSRDTIVHFLAAHRGLYTDYAYHIEGKELRLILKK
jgi:glycosyltransferase involved in cell wall biosynthesis